MNGRAGWTIGRSILIELGLLLENLGEHPPLLELTPSLQALTRDLGDGWYADRIELLGRGRAPLLRLVVLAWLADAIFVDDYTEATRRVRDLDLPTALARMEQRCAARGIALEPSAEPGLRLALAWRDLVRADISASDLPELISRPIDAGHPVAGLPRLLRGGDLHDRFWHWLDRFYYQTYAPWREAREPDMQALAQRGIMLLGAEDHRGRPPRLDWMPPTSPLLNFPGLRRAAEEGRAAVFFLVEPQGVADILLMTPGLLVTVFAEKGALHDRYYTHVEDLATRLKAVADPTRLKLLRLIRHLELDNTQIAAFLQVSRPTVSVHARQLREAGLIETRREGRRARHTVDAEAVRALFTDLERLLALPED